MYVLIFIILEFVIRLVKVKCVCVWGYRQSQLSLNAAGAMKPKTESNDVKKQKTKSPDAARLTEADKAKTGRVSQSSRKIQTV